MDDFKGKIDKIKDLAVVGTSNFISRRYFSKDVEPHFGKPGI